MREGCPSMTAPLGLLALAGYRNRGKIAEMPGRASNADPGGVQAPPRSQGIDPGRIFGGVAGAGASGFLNGGLGEMLSRSTRAGHGEAARSWVDRGPNRELPAPDLEHAVGPDAMQALARRTGLSRHESLSRLARDLPDAFDRYTPDGRIPARATAHK